jgi:preprotein translocase subunit Sec61beta
MKSGPSKAIPSKAMEVPIGILIPPACREEVLGDLYERYAGPLHYILDALRAVPLVIASRIRRTTDPAMFLMEALALYLSFLVGAWYIDRALLAEQWGLWRLAIPVGLALTVMVLRDAYARPGIRSRWEAVLRPVLGVGCALLVLMSWRAVPLWIVLWGGALSILLVSTLRMAFPPVADLPQGAGGLPFWQQYVTGPLGLPPRIAGYAAVAVAVLLWIIPRSSHRRPALLLWIVIVVLFVGRYKRS